MTVSDFDSNGLIFALSETASPEQGDLYRSAIRNIMDAQGFDIMPLVDGPRIRTNVNDMTARPLYANNGGNITHLAQRSGDSVEFFPMDQILTVEEDAPIFDCLHRLCSHMLEHASTPFVFIVVDSNSNPVALFSLKELLSRRLNDAMLSTYLGYKGIMTGKVEEKSRAIHGLLELFQSLQEAHEAYWGQTNPESRNAAEIHSLCSAISQQLRVFSRAKISLPRRRESPARRDQADVHLIDLMRHGAAGIIWNDEELTKTELAGKLLCKANDFDFLTLYDSPGLLIQTHVINKKGKRQYLEGGYRRYDDLLFDSLDDLFQDKLPLFILPSDEINTGEGSLVWPSILSFEEVKNHHGSLWLMTKIGELEKSIKRLLPKRSYLMKNGTSTHRDRLTLGKIIGVLKGENGDSDDIKPLNAQYLLHDRILTWRNDFSHGMRNGSLRLKDLNQEGIIHTVRCCKLWAKMTEADVRASGKKNEGAGTANKKSNGKKRSSKTIGKGKQSTKEKTQPHMKPKRVKIFTEFNSFEADLMEREDVLALYNNFDEIFGNRRQIHFTKLHQCVREGWFPGQPAKPFLHTLDVRAWVELFLKGEITSDIFLHSFEERRE